MDLTVFSCKFDSAGAAAHLQNPGPFHRFPKCHNGIPIGFPDVADAGRIGEKTVKITKNGSNIIYFDSTGELA